MSRVEELVAVPAAAAQAMRALVTVARFPEWVAPDVTVVPRSHAATLAPGDRFRLELVGTLAFDYTVEAASEREIVFAFQGPWSGRERWSFIADGAETLVRRVYQVEDAAPLAALAWRTVGRPVVLAHLKLELARFRAMLERSPGPRGEVDRGPVREAMPPDAASFPVDEG